MEKVGNYKFFTKILNILKSFSTNLLSKILENFKYSEKLIIIIGKNGKQFKTISEPNLQHIKVLLWFGGILHMWFRLLIHKKLIKHLRKISNYR